MTCRFCNGFYSSAYGQPVCRVCHNFLFEYPVEEEAHGALHVGETPGPQQEKDAGHDSGNEEAEGQTGLAPDRSSPPLPGLARPPMFDLANLTGTRPGPGMGTTHRRMLNAAIKKAAAEEARQPQRVSNSQDQQRQTRNYFEHLPYELLVHIFSYCSDVTLWSLYQSTSRFRDVIDAEIPDQRWRAFVQYRWPLFRPRVLVRSWRQLYGRMFASTPCRYCLERWRRSPEVPIEPESWRHSRVQNEVISLRTEPPDGIEAVPLDERSCHWQATIAGPPDSPYEGGLFFLHVYLPHSYPMRPPRLRFFTRIFHPNVSRHGEVGLDAVSHNWSLALTLGKILISVQSLLTDAYTHVCMEPAVGRLYTRDRAAFEMRARLWTRLYAMHDFLLPPIPTLPSPDSACRFAELDSEEEL